MRGAGPVRGLRAGNDGVAMCVREGLALHGMWSSASDCSLGFGAQQNLSCLFGPLFCRPALNSSHDWLGRIRTPVHCSVGVVHFLLVVSYPDADKI